MEATVLPSTPYDKVLYAAGLFPQTHPDRLASTAYLRGMSPASIERCRVLELGCGAANNLVSMAFQLPGSEFVGIDLARIPVACGQALVAELRLRNVTLEAMDICDPTLDQFGAFDFIIAHGVYSWVPQPVRQRILQICRSMLNPMGIAYISYNAYPGCHFRDLVRHMMRFHTQKFESLAEKTTQARALVKFIAECRKKPDYYTEAFRFQLERLLRYEDESLYHDDLNPCGQPFYFHEFVEEAERHDLKYVGEAALDTSDRALFTEDALRHMTKLEGAHEIVQEQYKDFLGGTDFRQTLLCRKETPLTGALALERVPELFAICDWVAMADPERTCDAPIEFESPQGRRIEVANSVWRFGLSYICSQWPCAVSFEQILDEVKRKVGRNLVNSEASTIAAALTQSYLAGVVSLRLRPPDVVNRVTERPAMSRLAQAQLRLGTLISSQLHRSMKSPDAASKHFMSLLDGTRDHETLAAEMIAFARSTQSNLEEVKAVKKNSLEIDVKERIKNNLKLLMRAGMLVG
jgi:methyltransferase-like protein/2-polyprenyl-3-methyl-5-hydroxy-6-metoxy-1,4-benzoquinol methylase